MHWLIYPLAGFIALLFLMQFLALRRARQSEGRAAPDTTAVDGAAHADRRRVYYFHATHCGPCRAMTPVVDRLRTEHRNLIEINVAKHLIWRAASASPPPPASCWWRTAPSARSN